jgi:hypothetical protein
MCPNRESDDSQIRFNETFPKESLTLSSEFLAIPEDSNDNLLLKI